MSTGTELLQKANKKASGGGGFSLFGGSSARDEEARDLYIAAANSFKLEKKWKESGDAFCQAGEKAIKLQEKDDALNDFWNAAKSYKKQHPELAVACLDKTITFLLEKGRFRQAADRKKEIGQIFQEKDALPDAITAFREAGDWYVQEDAQATANACFKDVADLAARVNPPQWDVAIENFERVAKASLNSALTKYSVKEYYLKAGMCHLALGDVVAAQKAYSKYTTDDPSFGSTREGIFLQHIIEAYDAKDQEGFLNYLREYDSITKLDNWKTSVLLAVKNSMGTADDDVDLT